MENSKRRTKRENIKLTTQFIMILSYLLYPIFHALDFIGGIKTLNLLVGLGWLLLIIIYLQTNVFKKERIKYFKINVKK